MMSKFVSITINHQHQSVVENTQHPYGVTNFRPRTPTIQTWHCQGAKSWITWPKRWERRTTNWYPKPLQIHEFYASKMFHLKDEPFRKIKDATHPMVGKIVNVYKMELDSISSSVPLANPHQKLKKMEKEMQNPLPISCDSRAKYCFTYISREQLNGLHMRKDKTHSQQRDKCSNNRCGYQTYIHTDRCPMILWSQLCMPSHWIKS